MKGVLITGGAGKIGYNLVEKLVDTSYNVTILDLESKKSIKRLSKFKNTVKIVYGDIEDEKLITDLVKRNDIVINYAGVMPPFANLNSSIANSTNFGGTKNIVDAIKLTNPDCIYIHMSFISIYGDTSMTRRCLTVGTESNYPDDYYSVSLARSEEYIKTNLKKYLILRMPIVLTCRNYFINHIRLDTKMNFITKENLNDILLYFMKNNKKGLGKTYNIGGFEVNSNEVVEGFYKATGRISILNRNLYYGIFDDADLIEKQTGLKCDNCKEAFEDIKRENSNFKTTLLRIFNFPKYFIFKNRKKQKRK